MTKSTSLLLHEKFYSLFGFNFWTVGKSHCVIRFGSSLHSGFSFSFFHSAVQAYKDNGSNVGTITFTSLFLKKKKNKKGMERCLFDIHSKCCVLYFLRLERRKKTKKKIRKEINVSMVAGIRKKSFKVKSWEVIFFFFILSLSLDVFHSLEWWSFEYKFQFLLSFKVR